MLMYTMLTDKQWKQCSTLFLGYGWNRSYFCEKTLNCPIMHLATIAGLHNGGDYLSPRLQIWFNAQSCERAGLVTAYKSISNEKQKEKNIDTSMDLPKSQSSHTQVARLQKLFRPIFKITCAWQPVSMLGRQRLILEAGSVTLNTVN